MDHHLTVKHYKIHPLREGIIVGLAIFSVALITIYFILHHALKAEKEEISEGMLRQAKIIATLIDGDLHQSFTHSDQEGTPEYNQAIAPLKRALLESCDKRLSTFEEIFEHDNGCSLIFVYTAILKNNKVHYVLDPWPSGIVDPDVPTIEMKSHLLDVYEDASPEMLASLHEKTTNTTEIFTDDWGTFISAYAPFYTRSGQFVGIVGVDMKVERYLERLKPIKQAFVRAFVAIFFIAYLVGAMVWFLRRFTLIINTKRIRLKDEYSKLSGEVTHDE